MSCTTMLASCSLKCLLLWICVRTEPRGRHHSSEVILLHTSSIYSRALLFSQMLVGSTHLPSASQTPGKTYPPPQKTPQVPGCFCRETGVKSSALLIHAHNKPGFLRRTCRAYTITQGRDKGHMQAATWRASYRVTLHCANCGCHFPRIILLALRSSMHSTTPGLLKL